MTALAACPGCVAAGPAAEDAATGAAALTLSVPGMHCAGCIASVERALRVLPGVTHARANLSRRQVRIARPLAKAGHVTPAVERTTSRYKGNEAMSSSCVPWATLRPLSMKQMVS